MSSPARRYQLRLDMLVVGKDPYAAMDLVGAYLIELADDPEVEMPAEIQAGSMTMFELPLNG